MRGTEKCLYCRDRATRHTGHVHDRRGRRVLFAGFCDHHMPKGMHLALPRALRVRGCDGIGCYGAHFPGYGVR